ncbi:MAG: hypothetical protein NC541_00770 [bacterium]|nr:hypothetical protein [bacterium]
MGRIVNNKLFSRIPYRRILYSICFCMFCVIDQRIRTAYQVGGWLETFRDLTGVVMAVIILSHYRLRDFRKWKIPYLLWSVAGGGAAIAAFFWGIYQQKCLNEWFVILLDIFLFGYVVIHTFIDVVLEKKRARLDKRFGIVWFVMMVLMVLSKSEQMWPLYYLVMFGAFYLTDYDGKEQEDLLQGMLDGVILSFFLLQGLAFVSRPYVEVRYRGFHYNPNMNALFYLEVLAAVLSKLLMALRGNASRWLKLYYWLGVGVVLSFLFMTVGRTAWITAFFLVVVFLWAGKKGMAKKSVLKQGIMILLCACLTFPACFGAARYFPPLFHHHVWFADEWHTEKVDPWNPWDPEKNVDLDEFLDYALGKLWGSIGAALERSPFLLNADAAQEQPQLPTDEERRREEAWAGMGERLEIYKYCVSRLNLWGNAKIGDDSWAWHAHNIFLQYGTDFGIVVLALFITIYGWNLIFLVRRFLMSNDEKHVAFLLFSLITLLYGMLELTWGPGSIALIMMFFAWGSTIRLDTAPETV